MQFLRIFFTGLLISFLGTLPFGTLNAAVLQISAGEGTWPAIYFSLGVLLVEMAYVRVSLVAMDWVRKRKQFFRWLEWVSILIVVILAISSFVAAVRHAEVKNLILGSSLPKFILGMAMSAVNPVQIPFWFGWSTVLFTKKILLPQNNHYHFYIAGIGFGTFAGNALFIYGGRLVIDKLNANQHILNWVIGSVFAITALIMIWRMLMKKDAFEKVIGENPK